ncbi:MAG: hypothetical protein IKU78_05535 [Paludibacteraceae bacterium]|nr:hypothetical protein [Paludibacteraceae bacterium]
MLAENTIKNIGKKDVIWSLIANILRIGYGIILFPLILQNLPSEDVAFWTIFTSITALVYLFDFGFSGAFTRNVSFIFSGIQKLKKEGFHEITGEREEINYSLLKGVIFSMKYYYSRIALCVSFLLLTIGTFYIYTLLKTYTGNTIEIYIAWFLHCAICTYNIYTLYYEALLQGKGHIKTSKQYAIVGSLVNLIVAVVLILLKQGLIAIVVAQICSIIIVRYLSKRKFFSKTLCFHLSLVSNTKREDVLKNISPNAIKIGLTSVGGYAVLKSALFIGSIFLPLTSIASYGITMQIIAVADSIGKSYYQSYNPQICQLRINNRNNEIKKLYIKSSLFCLLTFLCFSIITIFGGNWILNTINSNTALIPSSMLFFAFLFAWLEANHSIAGGFLLANNEVPFFKASIVSGITTIILLLIMFNTNQSLGLWIMIFVPGIVQLLYQNWRWPYVLLKSL